MSIFLEPIPLIATAPLDLSWSDLVNKYHIWLLPLIVSGFFCAARFPTLYQIDILYEIKPNCSRYDPSGEPGHLCLPSCMLLLDYNHRLYLLDTTHCAFSRLVKLKQGHIYILHVVKWAQLLCFSTNVHKTSKHVLLHFIKSHFVYACLFFIYLFIFSVIALFASGIMILAHGGIHGVS